MVFFFGNFSYFEYDSGEFYCYYLNKYEMYVCIFVYRLNWICNYWNNCWRFKWWICKYDNLYVFLYFYEFRNFCLYCIIWFMYWN